MGSIPLGVSWPVRPSALNASEAAGWFSGRVGFRAAPASLVLRQPQECKGKTVAFAHQSRLTSLAGLRYRDMVRMWEAVGLETLDTGGRHVRQDGGKAQKAVILVGHGGVPTDCPRTLVTRLKTLEAQRRASGQAPSAEELDLDRRIRHWPRTPQTDPYRDGLEALAAALRPLLHDASLAIAYNEFCTPTLEEAAEAVIAAGATSITVVPSMLTPGGVHSEVEIPETLDHLHLRYPGIVFQYAWPVDLGLVARMLADQLGRLQSHA
jgi:sirohydrochlorin cobaltochelatase